MHSLYEIAVERAKSLFLSNKVVVLGLSGKDSGAASICVVEALKRAKQTQERIGSLYIVTTNTTLDNMVLHDYMMQLHDDLNDYASEHNLPLKTLELKPPLSNNPMVEYIGKGKLLRTNQTSSNGRDCAVNWKLRPLQIALRDIANENPGKEVVSISGSRDSESNSRKINLEKRGESAIEIVETEKLGKCLALIKEWSLNDVWSLLALVDDGDLESYSDNFYLMKKHYSAANSGTCDLYAGGFNDKACGSRFGCTLCALHEKDRSLEGQINIDPKTYGFMKPMLELREYLINTLFDYNNRSRLGRELKDGFIKVGINQYSMEYRMNLLRYVLTIQQKTYDEFGSHLIDLIDFEQLVAIQFHWAREGGEPAPGMAFRIWNEIVVNGENYYDIPRTRLTSRSFIPEYRWFQLQSFMDRDNSIGLDDNKLSNSELDARFYQKDGVLNRVVSFKEAQRFEVNTKDAKAMMFVESFFPSLLEDGELDKRCPTVIAKYLLISGIVKLSKGQINRVNSDVKRAQGLFALETNLGVPIEDAIQFFSVSESEMKRIVFSRNKSA